MAISKGAIIRYKILDKCFGNAYRRYFIDDLISECSKGMTRHFDEQMTISRRQIFEDINFMKSDAGYSAPIESFQDGRKVYYRYEDDDFSIEKSPINPDELAQITDALEIFNRIKGLPNFQWVGELETKLRDTLDSTNTDIMSFDHNPYLIGIDHLQGLYNFIKNSAVLKISYKSFKMDTPVFYIIHPYHLKQYNNRWFLFGLNQDFEKIQNLALDRIISIEHISVPYIPCSFDFEDFFEDIIGVTNPEDKEAENILLQFTEQRLPYVLSKPLHGSQKFKTGQIHLNLKVNREFISLILSFGSDVTVIEPESLKVILIDEAKKIFSQNIVQ
jgi:predicted DNA-binding transcriptional regulator YafY